MKDFLGEISSESHNANKGMLSVYAVTKASGKPGSGFFTLAKTLGYSIMKNGEE